MIVSSLIVLRFFGGGFGLRRCDYEKRGIAERRHPAISDDTKGMADERHWMRKRSDPPLPIVNDLLMRHTESFERYWNIDNIRKEKEKWIVH